MEIEQTEKDQEKGLENTFLGFAKAFETTMPKDPTNGLALAMVDIQRRVVRPHNAPAQIRTRVHLLRQEADRLDGLVPSFR